MENKVTIDTKIWLFLKTARKIFGIDMEEGRGGKNSYYIDVPTILSEEQIERHSNRLTNPFIFTTGIFQNTTSGYTDQSIAQSPSISIILGQYGVGKTELVHQLCNYLLQKNGKSKKEDDAIQEPLLLEPLPISLYRCYKFLWLLGYDLNGFDVTSKNLQTAFANFFFDHILNHQEYQQELLNYSIDNEFIIEEIIPRINDGKILLILDGLDELITDKSQHNPFFNLLITFLKNNGISLNGQQLRFRIVISMRLEYLKSIDNSEKPEFVKTIKQNYPISFIYFLKLNYFDIIRVKEYLFLAIKNKESSQKICERVEKKDFLEILYRPLLLKLFCELANQMTTKELEFWLSVLDAGQLGVNELFEKYIYFTSEKMTDDKTQQALSLGYTWDISKLSEVSLKIYKESYNEMSLEDIVKFIDFSKNGDESEEIRQKYLKKIQEGCLSEKKQTEIFKCIHKIPFLQRVSYDKVRFSHRAFLEFFTAKGMKQELDEKGDHQNVSFDDLVLNEVETRKFLKAMVGKEWYTRTQKSYSLNREDFQKWPYKDSLNLEELNKYRIQLLDLMTDPHNCETNDINAIKWFLDKAETGCLHPHYLMYNFEAVAVYIWYNQWEKEAQEIGKKFSKLLKVNLESVLEKLIDKNLSNEEKKALELLKERILNIAHRLRYLWIVEKVENIAHQSTEQTKIDEKYHLKSLVNESELNDEVSKRIQAIIDSIKNSLLYRIASTQDLPK